MGRGPTGCQPWAQASVTKVQTKGRHGHRQGPWEAGEGMLCEVVCLMVLKGKRFFRTRLGSFFALPLTRWTALGKSVTFRKQLLTCALG